MCVCVCERACEGVGGSDNRLRGSSENASVCVCVCVCVCVFDTPYIQVSLHSSVPEGEQTM